APTASTLGKLRRSNLVTKSQQCRTEKDSGRDAAVVCQEPRFLSSITKGEASRVLGLLCRHGKGDTKMLPWDSSQWTETYLLSLHGQPESARLEYKSARAIAKKEDREKCVRHQLPPAVSAFANSEGGIRRENAFERRP